jgi:signal peptidase I
MTMDNGEGRPLDEVEAGNDDPQGWYFDLPGGAWERQEEKNRTLRQRVLGNLSEDEAKARSDPFGKKPAEPEKKEGGRGFFGRRKKEDDSNQRTSAGGTWVLNRGNQPDEAPEPVDFAARNAQADADDDADDWSTEPPLKLTPFPRAESRSESTWGEPDAGWNLSAPTQQGPGVDEPEAPITFARAEVDADGQDEADAGTQDFLASMRSWAHEQQEEPAEEPAQFRVPTYEEAAATETWEEEPEADQSPLTLRPRRQDPDEKQLDWNFGPAAWSDEPDAVSDDRRQAMAAAFDETRDSDAHVGAERFAVALPDDDETVAQFESADTDEPVFARNDDSAAFTETLEQTEPAPEEDSLESMRRWAERNRDADHPHFTVHHETPEAEQGAPQPSPIPLRPRAHDDAAPPSSFAPAPPSSTDDASRAPLQLPIARRPREEDAEPIHSEKWNDFFAISPKDETATDDEGGEQGSEGLAAMRAWAQKRPEPETPGDIPEEFLKPFDWELEEEAPEAAAALEAVPAELLKPFAWESEEPRNESPFELDSEPGATAVEVAPVAELQALAHVPDTVSAVDDPLDGIFPAATDSPRDEKKKGGRFGRLFGRGKNKEAAREEELETITAGDWLLPGDDAPESDIRVAAKLEDWAEDAGTLEAPAAPQLSGEGWGASLAEGWSNADKDAIQEFSHALNEPDAEWEPEPAAVSEAAEFELPAVEWESAAAAFSIEETPAASSVEAAEEFGWDPEPVAAPFEAVASVETAEEPAATEKPWWEQPAVVEAEPEVPAEAVASVEPVATEKQWWEQPAIEAEAQTPVEAVASSETVEEPAVAEKPWWEQPAAIEAEPEPEAPVEAVASVETVEEPAATEKRWWEQPAIEAEPEPEAPVAAVAFVETVEEPVATEKPWWEQPAIAVEPETPVEAAASVEPAEEPAAAEKPWWEQPAAVEAEPEAPVEVVAAIEAVEEPVATEKPWWEQPAIEAEPEAPAEAVASVETLEEPVPTEKPWWEQPAAVAAQPEASVEAVASIETVEEPVATEKPWWEQPAASEIEPEPEAPVEAVASVETVEEPAATEKPWWQQPVIEPEAPVEAVASIETVEEPPAAEKPWWEQPAAVEPEPEAPAEAVASVETAEEPAVTEKPWWEQPAVEAEAEPEAPVEAVASVQTVEEPVATEKPWWEQPAIEAEPVFEAPVEAVASVETVEEPAATDKPWWEQPAAVEAEPEPETPVEAVASVETVEEPATTEKQWWQQPEAEPEAPVEAVASIETLEEPAAAEKPWWEQPAIEAEPEPEAPVKAVAFIETVEEPAATEKPWWEQPAAVEAEPEPPAEAVASVEPAEEPAAAEKPWWEQPAAVEAEPEPPVEAVASVEAVDEPIATEKPWWEQPAAIEAEPEPETPVEAVASIETLEEPAATEKPWWQQPAIEAEPEAPAEAVASVETVEEPAATEKPWWEQPAAVEAEPEAEAPVEAVAEAVEAPAAAFHDVQPDAAAAVAETDDDDPWADFVKTPADASSDVPPPPLSPRWGHEPVQPQGEDDMWGHIAAQAEEHAAADHQLDLAASLESQMADEPSPPAYSWNEPEEDEWVAAPRRADSAGSSEHDEDDVILAAFERHAATPDAPAARESDEVFAELLGTEAAEIVAEASDDDTDHSFIKMSGWAPQRRAEFDGGWAPEQEVEQALSNSRPPAFGGSDGAGFAPPTWALDEFEGGAEAAPAVGGHHRTKTWIRELVETGLLALLVFLSVRASFQNFKVEGSSMWPTLENGEFLIVNKLVYSEVDMDKLSNFVPFVDAGSDPKRNVFHGPERGDIIVLKDPRNTETDLIKRVIGLPGETIEIVDGKVYINDHLLEEPYIKAIWHDTKPKVLIPPGEYFVMGDNRDNSLDSRSSQVGLVPQDLIIGKAMLSYWPREKFGLAPNEEGKLGEEKPVLTTKTIGE